MRSAPVSAPGPGQIYTVIRSWEGSLVTGKHSEVVFSFRSGRSARKGIHHGMGDCDLKEGL